MHMQRIATATSSGGPSELKLERFSEALEDATTGLTYAALTGQNKQSVRDAKKTVQQRSSGIYEQEEL